MNRRRPKKKSSTSRVIWLSTRASNAIRRALCRAQRRETGGVLFGQILTPDELRILHATVAGTGTSVSFTRDAGTSARRLQRYFKKHSGDMLHHNYAGEWHSHPSFPLEPSCRDAKSIEGLLDELSDARFLVLLLAKLHRRQPQFRAYIWTRNDRSPNEVPVAVDSLKGNESPPARRVLSQR